MLDQSFSAHNLRKIFNEENRRGRYLEKALNPDILKVSDDLSACREKIRSTRKKISSLTSTYKHHPTELLKIEIQNLEESKQALVEKKRDLIEKKDGLIDDVFEKLSQEISTKPSPILIEETSLPTGIKAFKLNEDIKARFILLQVQRNLKKSFNVKPSNRQLLIRQLKQTLDDNYKKILIRTDIKDFYESIDQHYLLEILEQNISLSAITKKIISDLLDKYNAITGKNKGIPRGIGISAYLSEIYLAAIDNKLKNSPDVIFYGRYVDDIVVVIDGHKKDSSISSNYLSKVIKDLDLIKLQHNPLKTPPPVFYPSQNISNFEFLGYSFQKQKGSPISIDISIARKKRYRKKVKVIFEHYKRDRGYNEKIARKELIARLKFLSGNTRLVNNKQNALIGVYFSNQEITNLKFFDDLDLDLQTKATSLGNPLIAKRISKISFKEGFLRRIYRKFNPKKITELVGIWRYEK